VYLVASGRIASSGPQWSDVKKERLEGHGHIKSIDTHGPRWTGLQDAWEYVRTSHNGDQ
jgi:hypothetical protein